MNHLLERFATMCFLTGDLAGDIFVQRATQGDIYQLSTAPNAQYRLFHGHKLAYQANLMGVMLNVAGPTGTLGDFAIKFRGNVRAALENEPIQCFRIFEPVQDFSGAQTGFTQGWNHEEHCAMQHHPMCQALLKKVMRLVMLFLAFYQMLNTGRNPNS